MALLAVLGGLFFLFSKPVPAAADGLVKMALALQGKSEDPNLNADDMPDLDDVPETDVTRDDPLGEQPNQEQASGQRAGDSMSQSRKLPQRADVQGSHEPLVYLDLDSEPQAYALAQRPIYVRSSTLGEYADGSWGRVGEGISPRWIFDQQDGREDGTVSLPEEFPRAAQAARVSYKIYVKGSTGAALLAMQGVSEFELPQVMRYDDDWYRSSKIGNIAYRAASRPLSLEDVIGAERLRPGKIAKVYSEVPDSVLMRRIQQLLDNQMPFGSLTERLLWLKQYLEANYQYSTTVANVDNLDPLENFLFEEKRGYCDFYATAAALMVRMMGVPSRIGYGFSKGEFDGEKLFTFYEDGAHSWPEIFLEDQGWVVFDVTPSGQAGGGQAEQPNEPRERPDLSGFEQPENDPLTKDGGNNDPLLSKIDEENSAVSDLVSYLVFCAALLAFALWYYLKRDEAREAEGEVGGSDGKTRKLPAYLAEFCRLVKACGLDPQHGETIVEMMKSLRAVGVPVDGFEEMKRYHYSTRYEDSPLDPGLEKQFLREVKAFVKEKTRSD
jgi:transglutaminase-like putative cysteine protease